MWSIRKKCQTQEGSVSSHDQRPVVGKAQYTEGVSVCVTYS